MVEDSAEEGAAELFAAAVDMAVAMAGFAADMADTAATDTAALDTAMVSDSGSDWAGLIMGTAMDIRVIMAATILITLPLITTTVTRRRRLTFRLHPR